MTIPADLLTALQTRYKNSLADTLIISSAKALLLLFGITLVNFVLLDAQSNFKFILTIGLFFDLLALRFWLVVIGEAFIVTTFFLLHLRRLFGTSFSISNIISAHHRQQKRSLFDIGDIFGLFGLLVLFTFLTGQLYSFIFARNWSIYGGIESANKSVWWAFGSLGMGFVLACIHFYAPIYRAKFASQPEVKYIDMDTALWTIAQSVWIGAIFIGGSMTWLLFDSIRPLFAGGDIKLNMIHVLLSPSMLFHFHLFCALNFILLKSVESVIQFVVTGRNLRVTAEMTDHPMATLLGGLVDHPGFAQDSAIYELFELVLFEKERRKKQLFLEPIEDTLVVKEIISFALRRLNMLSENCHQDILTLRQLEVQLLGKGHQMLREALSVKLREALPNERIVSPGQGLVDSLIGKVLASPSVKPRSVPQKPRVPSVLSRTGADAPPMVDISSHATPTIPMITYAPKLVKSVYGQALLTIWINGHQRVCHLANYQTVECLVSALAAIVVSSYEEDCHGQVQLQLEEILSCLVKLYQTLSQLNAPVKGFSQCPPNAVVDSVLETCKLAIEAVVAKFTMATLESPALRLPHNLLADIKDICDRTQSDTDVY